jgi:hypothetical protein
MRLSPDETKQLMDFIAHNRGGRRMHVTFSCEAYLGNYEQI